MLLFDTFQPPPLTTTPRLPHLTHAAERRKEPPRGMPSVSLVTWNVRGLGGIKGLNRLMTYMQKNKTNDKLAVVMGQEHNLRADELDTARTKALIRDFQLIVTSGRADDPTSSRGGVFILIDTKQMSEAKILHEDPGFIRVTVDWESQPEHCYG